MAIAAGDRCRSRASGTIEPLRTARGAYSNAARSQRATRNQERAPSSVTLRHPRWRLRNRRRETYMGLGVSIFLRGRRRDPRLRGERRPSRASNIHTIGWILLIVGIVGVVLSMIFWSSWAGPGYWLGRRRTTYVEDGPGGPRLLGRAEPVRRGAAARPLRCVWNQPPGRSQDVPDRLPRELDPPRVARASQLARARAPSCSERLCAEVTPSSDSRPFVVRPGRRALDALSGCRASRRGGRIPLLDERPLPRSSRRGARRPLANADLHLSRCSVPSARARCEGRGRARSRRGAEDAPTTPTGSRTEFVSIASHELRAPIAVVHGIAATLHARVDELAARAGARAARPRCVVQTDRLRDLADQLLDLSRIEPGGRAGPRALRPARAARRARAEDRRRPPTTSCVAGRARARLVADPVAFERVAANLILNALRYGGRRSRCASDGDVPPGRRGPRPGRRARVRAAPVRALQPQRREPPRRRRGAGLGLSIAARLRRRRSAASWLRAGAAARRALHAVATGSSTVNVEPRRPRRLDPDASVHPVHELAADVEAEPGAADAAGQVRVEAVELLEDPPLLAPAGCRGPGRRRGSGRGCRGASSATRTRAAVGRVLDRVVDEVRQHLAQLVRVGRDRRQRVGAPRRRARPSAGACARTASTTSVASAAASQLSIAMHICPESSRLAQRMSLTIRASRSASLEMTSSRPVALRLLELDVAALERQRRAVDRGERRAQLVRDGRDEVALQLLDRALLGHVAERVDRAAGERDGRDREPALAALHVERAASSARRARRRRGAARPRCGRARSASRGRRRRSGGRSPSPA